ncbi:MAG TPA: hypothetical protein VKV39_09915 [Candidatus Sulfotelmatobacter sp.]|nr:hypothetical protein [Candidatus Sulfotelmatobacter sp.]
MKRLATFALIALLAVGACLPASAKTKQKYHNKYQGLTKADRKAQAKEEKQMAKAARKQQKAERKMNKAVNKSAKNKHNVYHTKHS